MNFYVHQWPKKKLNPTISFAIVRWDIVRLWTLISQFFPIDLELNPLLNVKKPLENKYLLRTVLIIIKATSFTIYRQSFHFLLVRPFGSWYGFDSLTFALTPTSTQFLHWWRHLPNYLVRCNGRRGGLKVSALDSGASGPGSKPERGHGTLLSWCLSPPRCINGYRRI